MVNTSVNDFKADDMVYISKKEYENYLNMIRVFKRFSLLKKEYDRVYKCDVLQ